MNQLLNRLNLHPQERRLVVVVSAIVFVVLNLWFVWPHFTDWGTTMKEWDKAKEKLKISQRETDKTRLAELKTKLTELEGEGSAVAPSEQALNLISAITIQAVRSGVQINGNFPMASTSFTKTNDYFEKKAHKITYIAAESNLVNFLVALGSTNSMIRAHSMILQPDQPKYRLQGEITLVASYQKDLKKAEEPAKQAGSQVKKPEATGKPKTPAPKVTPAPKITPNIKPEPANKAKAPAGKTEPTTKPKSPIPPPQSRDKTTKT